ncbi:MAG: DNA polymerase III subunit gamma/tau [Cyclonatronaceae bacterium]
MSPNYKALTRAYRPQTFDDIVSQEHVSNTLKNAIEKNRLSHAYLFCGPRGVGKTTMARVLARTVNKVEMEVDGEQLNNTLNIVEIDAASNNSVDDVRSLRERVRIPPQSGRYKIYIIDEIHMLSKAAFNALLKTLEEPPDHVIFIFATTEPHRILPTILSRCQRFDFRRIAVDEIVDRLEMIAQKEDIEIDRESLHVIARKADGALRDALGILDQAIAFCGTAIAYDDLHRALNIVSSERMFELTDALIRRDARAGMALLHNLLHIGNDIQEFLAALTEHFRNLYLSKDTQNFYLIEATPEVMERFQKMSAAFSEDDLMRMMHIVHEAEYSIRHAQQPRIHLEITLLKLFHMTRSEGLAELLLKLEALEQKVARQPDSPSSGFRPDKNTADGPGAKGQPRAQDQTNMQNQTASRNRSGPQGNRSSQSSQVNRDTQNNLDSQSNRESREKQDNRRTSPQKEGAPARKESARPASSDGSGESGIRPQVREEPDIFGTPTLKRPRNYLSPVTLPGRSGNDTGSREVRGNLALSQKPDAPLQPNALYQPDVPHQSDAPTQNDALLQHHAWRSSDSQDGSSQLKKPAAPKTGKVAQKPDCLDDLNKMWPAYLARLQATTSSMLYFSIQKARPVRLKKDTVTLECNDSFTSDIIREQQRKLCDVVKEHFGYSLRFKSQLVEQDQRTDTIEDPYEKFAKMQKKDPKLQKIVSLFGAELDY